MILLVSCNPSKKAHEFASSHPKEFADFCATTFPAKDSSFVHDSTSFDTLYLERPPVIETTFLHDTVLRTVYYPGSTQFITKTVKKDSIIIRVDQAAVQSQVNKVNDLIVNNKDLISQRDKYKDKYNWWRIACLITWAAIVVVIVGKIYIGKIITFIKTLTKL